MTHHPFGHEFGAPLSYKEGDTEKMDKIRPLTGTDFVVRKETLPFPRSLKEVKKGTEAAEAYKVTRMLYKELSTYYGINVPNFRLVVGHDDKEPSKEALYVVTDYVDGKKFLSPENQVPKQRQIEIMEGILLVLFRYYRDKFEHGGKYLADIGLVGKHDAQYILGKCKTDVDDKIYLLDIDPHYRSIDKNETGERSNLIFFVTVDMLIRGMLHVENKVGSRFAEARRVIADFLKEIPTSRSSYWMVESMKKELDHTGP